MNAIHLYAIMKDNRISWSAQDIGKFIEAFQKAGYMKDHIEIVYMAIHKEFQKNGRFNLHYTNDRIMGILKVQLYYNRMENKINVWSEDQE